MTPPAYAPPPTAHGLARRAGVTLLVLGLLAVPFAGIAVLFAVLLPTMQNDASLRPTLDDLQQQLRLGSDAIRAVVLTVAGIFAVYAAAALTLAVGLLASGRSGWRVAATVLCGLVLTLTALNALASLMTGNAAGLVEAFLIGVPHGLTLLWLTQARVAPEAVPVVYVPPPYRPMQDYYLPPIEPPVRA